MKKTLTLGITLLVLVQALLATTPPPSGNTVRVTMKNGDVTDFVDAFTQQDCLGLDHYNPYAMDLMIISHNFSRENVRFLDDNNFINSFGYDELCKVWLDLGYDVEFTEMIKVKTVEIFKNK